MEILVIGAQRTAREKKCVALLSMGICDTNLGRPCLKLSLLFRSNA